MATAKNPASLCHFLALFALACDVAAGGDAILQPPPARIPTYTVTDLGVLPGYQQSRGLGINNAGMVVGFSDKFVERDFLIYFQEACGFADGAVFDLGASGNESMAEAINSSGVIVGATDLLFGQGFLRAFRWEDGTITDLGTLPGHCCSHALDVNDQGTVVGWSSGSDYFFFRWTPANGMEPLDIPASSHRPYFLAVNNADQIVGWYVAGNPQVAHGFVWSDGVTSELFGPNGEQAFALDINDSGFVVGRLVGGRTVAWRDGIVEDLAPDSDGAGSPLAVNIHEQSVGALGFVGVIWHNGDRYDLNRLVPPGTAWTIQSGEAVSDFGQVAGFGGTLIEGSRALLLTPIDSDVDDDGRVNSADFGAFQSCVVGPGTVPAPECEPLDLDRDGDVDFVDYRSLELAFEATG